MKAIAALLVLSLISRQADAWGGLFNRFSPEMLANMGYGAHGGGLSRAADEGILEELEMEEDDDTCYERKCSSNEFCCPGQICIDVDGRNRPSPSPFSIKPIRSTTTPQSPNNKFVKYT